MLTKNNTLLDKLTKENKLIDLLNRNKINKPIKRVKHGAISKK